MGCEYCGGKIGWGWLVDITSCKRCEIARGNTKNRLNAKRVICGSVALMCIIILGTFYAPFWVPICIFSFLNKLGKEMSR